MCGQPGGPGEENSIPSSDEPEGLHPPSRVIVNRNTVSFPYLPTTDHGGPPFLFWGGLTAFVATSVYLFGVYDRETGRYNESPEINGTNPSHLIARFPRKPRNTSRFLMDIE